MSGTELATREAFGVAQDIADIKAIVPQTGAEVEEFITGLIRCEMVPATYATMPEAKRRGAMAIAVMKGLELGWPPLKALQSIYIVNGMPTLYGDALPAFVFASGQAETYAEGYEGEGEKRLAWVAASRRGVAGVVRRTFSIADAHAQGLLGKKGPWHHSRDRMLMIRARTYLFRDLFADTLSGFGVKEEQEDVLTSRGLSASGERDTRRIDPLADEPEQAVIVDEDSTGAVDTIIEASPKKNTQAAGVSAGADGRADGVLEEPRDSSPADDDFPGDRTTTFLFTLVNGAGRQSQTGDGEQWADTLVGWLKSKTIDAANIIWKANEKHVADAEAVGETVHASRVWAAAAARGLGAGPQS